MSQSPYQSDRFNERQNFFETPSTRTRTSSEPVAADESLVASPRSVELLFTFYFLPTAAELRSASHSFDQMRHGDAEPDEAKQNHQQGAGGDEKKRSKAQTNFARSKILEL
jgi:hypothetical protein